MIWVGIREVRPEPIGAEASEPSQLDACIIEGFEPLLRLEEAAYRDAETVTVRTDDLKALISFAINASAMALRMGETMRARFQGGE